MRWLILAALLVGCGEETTAGGVGTGGSSAGSSGHAGVSGGGSGGSGGTGGTMALGGTGGTSATGGSGSVDAGLSCAIPADQVSGTAAAVHSTSKGGAGCSAMGQTIQIVNGTYWDTSWTLMNYATGGAPGLPGSCLAEFTFAKTTQACGMETLFAQVTVPAI